MSRRLSLGIALVVVVAMAVVDFFLFGWWAPFVAGLAIGALAGRARVTIPLGALLGLLAWGGPLLYDQARYGLGPAASSLAAIMGFGHQGAIPVVLTLLVGTLLGLTGAWLGSVAGSWLPVLQRATSR
ncbi:MAG TPA: hypothetical protein VLU92_03455 [Candidatus Dormibacteraeota bacterium]|nr:hypothetical protein [Candidatus Dormibacteraeota bacterium]